MPYQNDAVIYQFDIRRSGTPSWCYWLDDDRVPHQNASIGGALEDIRPLATDDEFCAFAGITKQQSAQLRYLGTGPRFIRVTGRQIRYDWFEIDQWCEARTVSRSDQRGNLSASRAENEPLDHAPNRTRAVSRRQAAGKELTD
jgi:predicted DNA-binding transcriptional regulator AlpA